LKCQLNQLCVNILATNLLASAYGARTIRRLDPLVAVQFTPKAHFLLAKRMAVF
jgi:hypothetical protein